MAGLHFIEQQQEPGLGAKFAKSQQIFRRPRRDPTLALDRLDQDRRGLRRDCRAHRFEIVERYLAKSGNHRLETFFYFLLPGCRDPGQRSAMERAIRRENLETSFVVPNKYSRDAAALPL